MHPQIVKDKISILPDNPGCYLMKNKLGQIIYVGKAKVLKKRVKSYFIGAHQGKVQRMIDDICDFELIITKNEAEALVLESQLIKAHQPRYNILLKDDKSYPYIAITEELHPRLILTRAPKKKFKALFGPYVSAQEAKTVLEILNYMYPLRKCVKLPNKLCLYYHIKQCLGPCVYPISPQIYEADIKAITNFLKGNPHKVKVSLTNKMLSAAEKLEFEQAQSYKKMLETVETIFAKKGTHQTIKEDTDVISYCFNEELLAMQIFHIRDGSVVARESDVFVYDQTDVRDAIESYLYQFYHSKSVVLPRAIITDDIITTSSLATAITEINFYTPLRGTKKDLLLFAYDNAKKALEQKKLLAQNTYNITQGAVEKLGDILKIAPPHTIEIIDTANLQDTNIVSAVAVFVNGLPNKHAYRKFKIISTTVQDDYQSLREVVYRRMQRKIMEDKPMPDLLIVDGGLGHVNAAKEVLDSLDLTVPLIGLSKNSKHRTDAIVTTTGAKIPLKTTDVVFKLLGKMQEEVHRFVIDYHRKKRIKTAFSSELTNIPGIGDARRNELLAHFIHVDKIKTATVTELEQVLPANLAQKVYGYFKTKDDFK
ncbi:MAG: excinuclease ABC subunit UvrC [Culicoidibacterales bacterium]